MQKRIGITGICAAAEGLADIDALWAAWVSGERVSAATDGCTWEDLSEQMVKTAARNIPTGERPHVDLIVATTKGAIQREVAWMREIGNMKDEKRIFAEMPTLGREVERLVRVGGLRRGWCVSTACSSGLTAMIDAAMCVQDGDAERVVVVGGDVCGADGFIADGFTALKAVSVKGCAPFDRRRDGLKLGSGCGGCVVQELSADSVCEIRGWGVSSDAVHLTAPDREAGGLIRAMRQALAMAKLSPTDIDVVFAHGTGTRYNDAMEAVAIERVFLREGAKPAVTAVKGLIGHTFGGSGIIEGVLAARMILEQCVPGVTGLKEPEREDLDLLRDPRRMRVRQVMKVASGFGGMNAALIFSPRGMG